MNTAGKVLRRLTYRDQIRSPQWKEFSERIKQGHPFCALCKQRDSERTLHVHHLFYDFDRAVTEYDPSELVVLCEICHDAMHQRLKDFRKYVFGKLDSKSFQVLNGALAVGLETYDPLLLCHAIAEFISNRQLVENHAAAWNNQRIANHA